MLSLLLLFPAFFATENWVCKAYRISSNERPGCSLNSRHFWWALIIGNTVTGDMV